MVGEIRVCPLRAIEEVFIFVLFGFGVGAVGVGVGYFGPFAEYAGVDDVPRCDERREGGDAEDVARRDWGQLGVVVEVECNDGKMVVTYP